MAAWRHKIDIKQCLKEGTEAPAAAAGVLEEIAKLTSKEEFKDDNELDQIREEFQGIVDDPKATAAMVDEALERLYDWADDASVWCGL